MRKSYMLESNHYLRLGRKLLEIRKDINNFTDYENLIEATDQKEQEKVITKIWEQSDRNSGDIITVSELEHLKQFLESLSSKVYGVEEQNKIKYSINDFYMEMENIGMEISEEKKTPTEFKVHQ